jgi:hypothetical protein
MKTYQEFINENYLRMSTEINPMNSGNIYQSFQIPAFSVKLLGMTTARQDTEQKNASYSPLKKPLKKGDMIEIYDNKNKKVVNGKFLSGKRDYSGVYYEISLIGDDEKIRMVKTDGEIK